MPTLARTNEAKVSQMQIGTRLHVPARLSCVFDTDARMAVSCVVIHMYSHNMKFFSFASLVAKFRMLVQPHTRNQPPCVPTPGFFGAHAVVAAFVCNCDNAGCSISMHHFGAIDFADMRRWTVLVARRGQ